MLKQHGYISPEDMDVFTLEDDPFKAVQIISDFRDSQGKVGLEEPAGMKKG